MKKLLRLIFFGGALLTWAALIAWALLGDKFERKVTETRAELIGAAADRFIASNSDKADANAKVKTVAGLHHIPIEVDRFQDNIFRASGVANSFLIQTSEGNVLFDTGLATQAAKHKRLLQNAATGAITHIILSHSHADHIGATKFWLAEFPNAKVIAHRKFEDGQRYLTDLQDHFWNRNRLLYTFMPEEPGDPDSLFAYGGIKPDVTVADDSEYQFELGGIQFRILPAPGAEGEDNLVLFLPQSKALFSGDFFGPLFPMMPNLFTLRGEKFRDPVAYINSLDRLIDLAPELVLPSHFDPHAGASDNVSKMRLMRDATAFVHEQTIAGMNQGKSVWQLMDDIKLPKELDISQGHGKVSWNVRSIWEHYSTWFKFESTTELYSVPHRSVYPDLHSLTGGSQNLLSAANQKLQNNQLEQALHFVEIALAGDANNEDALQMSLEIHQQMLDRARNSTNNFSETGWLSAQIAALQNKLKN